MQIQFRDCFNAPLSAPVDGPIGGCDDGHANAFQLANKKRNWHNLLSDPVNTMGIPGLRRWLQQLEGCGQVLALDFWGGGAIPP